MTRGLLLSCAVFLGAASARAADPTPADLQPPAEQFRRSCERSLLPGLKRTQSAITLHEFDVLGRLAKDRRIKDILYVNRAGEVRWANKPELWGLSSEAYRKKEPPSTDALERALKANAAVVAPALKGIFEVAMPLISEGQLQGALDIKSDAKGIRGLGADAQRTLKRDAPIKLGARTAPLKDLAKARQAEQHFLAGLIAYQKGERLKARQEWTVSLQLDQGDPDYAAALKRVKDAK